MQIAKTGGQKDRQKELLEKYLEKRAQTKNSSGLHDIGQEKGYGTAQDAWMKGSGQGIFDAKV